MQLTPEIAEKATDVLCQYAKQNTQLVLICIPIMLVMAAIIAWVFVLISFSDELVTDDSIVVRQEKKRCYLLFFILLSVLSICCVITLHLSDSTFSPFADRRLLVQKVDATTITYENSAFYSDAKLPKCTYVPGYVLVNMPAIIVNSDSIGHDKSGRNVTCAVAEMYGIRIAIITRDTAFCRVRKPRGFSLERCLSCLS